MEAKTTQSIQSIERELTRLKSSLQRSTNDDAPDCLQGLRDFIFETAVLKEYIESTRDRAYTQEEMYKGRDYLRFKIPGNTAGRLGFTWSLINDYLDNQDDEEYFSFAYL
ncbi:hypothetical protein [Leptospira santarosai]|uniref:hypothetical protein n=1 Tax=Leptospira santarosai TaxID=28183 RepID=UPI0002489D85|nr:hypothetical protein [Leptospira santarosai]